jgi:hypothetical protein
MILLHGPWRVAYFQAGRSSDRWKPDTGLVQNYTADYSLSRSASTEILILRTYGNTSAETRLKLVTSNLDYTSPVCGLSVSNFRSVTVYDRHERKRCALVTIGYLTMHCN